MRFLRQSLTGLFLLATTVGLVLTAVNLIYSAIEDRLAQESKSPQGRERVFAVNVLTAHAGIETPDLTAFGEVQSRRSLEIRAAAGGTVIELAENFVEGGRVEAGQVLLRVDPANAQSILERAKSDLLDAEAEIRDAARALDLAKDELSAAHDQAELRQKALSRQQDLAQRGVGTAAAVETAELNASSARQAVLVRRQALTVAEARIDQSRTARTRAQIALEEAERGLADTTIEADFPGTLAEVVIVQGRLVSANEKLAKLVDPNKLEVAFRVSTSQYARLLNEQGRLRQADVRVTLDTLGMNLSATGRVTRDSAAVGEGQTGRLLFAQLESALGMKPGDFVTVHVQEAPLENVVRLPASALDPAGRVLVLGENDRLEALPVILLRRQGDDILVRSSALEGREVVTRRTPLLGAGIRVKPLRKDASANQAEDLIDLTTERRARLKAFVQDSDAMPDDTRAELLNALAQPRVASAIVKRIEARMGG